MSLVSAIPANLNRNDENNIPNTNKPSQQSSKMFSIGKEVCFLLLIALTTYASINSNENQKGGPIPTPFFSKGSLVRDFYKGELSEALLRAKEGDLAFIMYYAPWDADSQIARKQFEAVSHQHYKQVFFAGINCWHPNSECKQAINSIQQFPKLVAYVAHETGVEYRGPLDARYMSAFLTSIRQPLYRLHTAEDLVRLRTTYNAVLVAYLNFQGIRGGLPYRAVYETAVKFLERDVKQEVAFAVVTSFNTALNMGINVAPCIKLYLWNETLDFSGQFSSAPLVEWITSHLHQVTLWLTPPGVKSLTLGPYVSQGPALIMFTPFDNFVMYDLLRQVGAEYYNCRKLTDVTKLAHNISISVSERISKIRRAIVSCQSQMRDMVPTMQILRNVWTNLSCSQNCSPKLQCCQHDTITLAAASSPDPLSSTELSMLARREKCRHLTVPPSRLPATTLPAAVQGLACRNNRSISLLALDSSLFPHFASGLGVLDTDSTRVVMVNSQMETTHVLEGPITLESLGWFLVNFVDGKLERLQRVQSPRDATDYPDLTTIVSILELTSQTFLSVALNDSMNVVVLYYSPHCAFCHTMNAAFLSSARLLRNVPNLLFSRIDGENNDLPWQYVTPLYPSVIFFPARRKEESRVFPTSVPITVNSLMTFIIANLPLEVRLSAMIQVCYLRYPQGQWTVEQQECFRDVRKEVLEAISVHLTRYRAVSLHLPSSKDSRKALQQELSTLQYLKGLHLTLSISPHRLTEQMSTRARDEL